MNAAFCSLALMAISSLCACTSSPQPAASETRVVTVKITVEAPAGTPVVGIPVGLLMSRPQAVGKTNSAGKVVLTGTFPKGTSRVSATLVYQSTAVVQEGSSLEWKKFDDTVDAYWFRQPYQVQLTQSSAYTCSMVGEPAIQVSGTLEWEKPPPGNYVVVAPGGPLRDNVFSVGEPFVIKGLRKSASTELFLIHKYRQRVGFVVVSAAQAASSFDLGVIQGPAKTAGRPVDLVVRRASEVHGTEEDPLNVCQYVIAIRSDGTSAYWGIIDEATGHVSVKEHSDKRMHLPAGTYYVAHWPFFGPQASRLLRLLSNGRVADVEAAGVPKIVVPDDGMTTPLSFTFDAVQAQSAIKSVK